MNVRKSSSLTASVCSVCITASLVTGAAPAVAAELPAAQHRIVSAADQPYQLAATSEVVSNLLLVAGIPFQNLYTTLNTIGPLATVWVTGVNKALGAVYTGNWDQIPGYLQQAWTDTQKAFQKVLALPQTLITYDINAIQKLVASLGGGSTFSARSTSLAAASPVAAAVSPGALLSDLAVVAGIPFQNFYTVLNTLGPAATVWVTGVNKALGAIYTGQWDKIPGYLQQAWTDTQAAFQKVLALPATIINYDINAIKNLFAHFAPAATATTFVQSSRVQTLALDAGSSTETPTTADELSAGSEAEAGAKTGTKASETKGATETETTEESAATTEKPATTEESTDKKDTSATESEDAGSTTEKPAEKPADTTAEKPSETASETTSEKPSEKPAEKPAEKPSEKPSEKAGDKDADSTEGSATTTKKRGTYGKHARQDDDSTPSATAGESSTPSGPGRHRKAEPKSESSSPSSSSGESAAA